MNKLALKLLVIALFMLVGVGRAVAQPPPETVGWWEWAVTAAHASIESVRSATSAPELNEMPEVAGKLNQRASDINQRATTGNIKGEQLFPKIPGGVRLAAGQGATLEYLDKHHVSHIRSVKHHPELAAQPANLVFEPQKWNLARGSNDMTFVDKFKVRIHNAGASMAGAGKIMLITVAKGGAIGALIELPVTTTVETLHVINQRKTKKQALRDGAQTVGVIGLVGGITAGAVTAVSTVGLTVGAPVLIPLTVVGGSAYFWVSGNRVWRALDDESRTVVKERLVVVKGAIQNSFHEWSDQTRVATKSATKTLQEYIYAAIDAVAE